MMKTVFLLLIVALAKCQSQNTMCPPSEDIKPCSCKDGKNEKPWVNCEDLTSSDQLRKALKGMEGYKFSTFYLEKSNIGVLPADMFQNLDIQFLTILFSNLTALSENLNRPPFLGLESSLEGLEIRDGFTDENYPLTRLSLSHLKKLTLIQLEGNIMPSIGNDWFESGPYGLRELHLLDTSVSKLGSHAFEALKNIKMFSLTGGEISEIKRDLFPVPAVALESLDFSNNRITSLPENIFTKMPFLQEVFLENNDITSISEVIWAPVWGHLAHVHFYGNPLKCDENLKWIYKARLPESLQGHCTSPPKLLYRRLSNLTLDELE